MKLLTFGGASGDMMRQHKIKMWPMWESRGEAWRRRDESHTARHLTGGQLLVFSIVQIELADRLGISW